MKKLSLLVTVMVIAAIETYAQVSVSTDNSSPDPSAMLDVKSSSKGLLTPRVELTAINNPLPVSSPATGLLVYNTVVAGTPPNSVIPGYYCWSGTRWIAVLAPPGASTGDMQYWDGTQWVLIPAGMYGQQLFFCNGIPAWGGCIPVLATIPVSEITAYSVVSGGIVTLDGGLPVSARGACWSTHPDPTIQDSTTTDGTGTGSYLSTIAGLLPNTQYFVRSYATNNAGTGYGNEVSFTTLCEYYPTVSVSIEASANPVCPGESVMFTAIPANGGSTPIYQWKVNGSIAGGNSAMFSYIPSDEDTVQCTMTSSLPCTPDPASSNILVMSVNSLPLSPVSGTHVPSQTLIVWNWSASDGAAGYKWNTENNYTTATDLGTATSETETGLNCITSYTRYVWAYNDCGYSAPVTLTQTTMACWGGCGTTFEINHIAGNVAPVNKYTTYGTVANIPGEPAKCWITSNFGSDHQASAADDPTEASAGWYWQFNRKQGYKNDGSTSTPSWSISTINENSDWQTVNDPCAIELGAAWRLPTFSEWNNVDNAGGWNNWNDVWVSGLKLHAAGYLSNSDGMVVSRGSAGLCTSSSQFNSANSWYLYFDSSQSGINISTYKAYGFTVRCLTE